MTVTRQGFVARRRGHVRHHRHRPGAGPRRRVRAQVRARSAGRPPGQRPLGPGVRAHQGRDQGPGQHQVVPDQPARQRPRDDLAAAQRRDRDARHAGRLPQRDLGRGLDREPGLRLPQPRDGVPRDGRRAGQDHPRRHRRQGHGRARPDLGERLPRHHHLDQADPQRRRPGRPEDPRLAGQDPRRHVPVAGRRADPDRALASSTPRCRRTSSTPRRTRCC